MCAAADEGWFHRWILHTGRTDLANFKLEFAVRLDDELYHAWMRQRAWKEMHDFKERLIQTQQSLVDHVTVYKPAFDYKRPKLDRCLPTVVREQITFRSSCYHPSNLHVSVEPGAP